MTKHTPWTALYRSMHKEGWTITGADGWVIGNIEGTLADGETARLIAEAPAMEKSLRRMVRYYEAVFSPMEEPDWLIDARTILARIGGES